MHINQADIVGWEAAGGLDAFTLAALVHSLVHWLGMCRQVSGTSKYILMWVKKAKCLNVLSR